MLLSLPFILFSTIVGFLEVERIRGEKAEGYYFYSTVVGDIMIVPPSLAGAVLFLTVIGGLFRWHKWQATFKVLKAGWIVSVLMPLLPGLVPLHWTLKADYKDDFIEGCKQEGHESTYGSGSCDDRYNTETALDQTILAILYMFQVLPLVVTFPTSVMCGSLRVRGLIADSSLASWVVVIVAPFHSLIVLTSLVGVVQMAGSIFLVFGMLLQTLTPWLYVFDHEMYVSISTVKTEKKIDKNQKIMLSMTITSIILLIVWATTPNPTTKITPLGNNENFVLSYYSFFEMIFEGIGRLLVTTVVISDVVLHVTVRNYWHEYSRRDDEGRDARIKELFSSLHCSIGQRKLESAEADSIDKQTECPSSLGAAAQTKSESWLDEEKGEPMESNSEVPADLRSAVCY